MNVEIEKLINFKIHATHARTSILQFNDLLRQDEGGFAKADGVTNDLGIDEDNLETGLSSGPLTPALDRHDGKAGSSQHTTVE